MERELLWNTINIITIFLCTLQVLQHCTVKWARRQQKHFNYTTCYCCRLWCPNSRWPCSSLHCIHELQISSKQKNMSVTNKAKHRRLLFWHSTTYLSSNHHFYTKDTHLSSLSEDLTSIFASLSFTMVYSRSNSWLQIIQLLTVQTLDVS